MKKLFLMNIILLLTVSVGYCEYEKAQVAVRALPKPIKATAQHAIPVMSIPSRTIQADEHKIHKVYIGEEFNFLIKYGSASDIILEGDSIKEISRSGRKVRYKAVKVGEAMITERFELIEKRRGGKRETIERTYRIEIEHFSYEELPFVKTQDVKSQQVYRVDKPIDVYRTLSPGYSKGEIVATLKQVVR